MDTIGKRIKHARLSRGLTQAQLSELLGKNNNVEVNRWENDKQAPTPTSAKHIAKALDITLEWLMHGETGRTNALSHPEIKPLSSNTVNLKIIGSAYMGDSNIIHLEATDERQPILRDTLPMSVNKLSNAEIEEKYFVFLAKGQSMYPTILQNDILIAERIEDPASIPNNKIVIVVSEDGEIYCKRLRKKAGKYILVSDNTDKTRFPNRELTETDGIKIAGRLIFIQRNL